jgi:hypothetical protein
MIILSKHFVLDGKYFRDESALSMVRTLCGKHISKTFHLLTMPSVKMVLKESSKSSKRTNTASSSWTFLKTLKMLHGQKKKIRLEIDMLTWNNHLQVEKDTWVNRFLEQDPPSKELLFLALERAKKADNEHFSKAPNMLFHLIKQLPDLFVQKPSVTGTKCQVPPCLLPP